MCGTLHYMPCREEQISLRSCFKKHTREKLEVGVAQTLRVDIALEIGAASESVTVTENTSLLKTESGELSHNLETKRLLDLPVPERPNMPLERSTNLRRSIHMGAWAARPSSSSRGEPTTKWCLSSAPNTIW